ncbi:MAG: Gfo/Idh/MocA family oxidoreductase [Planctomycetes bacterium]|nr:Gfo/Idh/MocA family oxidoreductase [Planctomycetota bacterium]
MALKKKSSKPASALSRRDFLMTSAAFSATALVSGCATTPKRSNGIVIVPPGGTPDKLRVGLIGCGGRGTGAARNCVQSSANVEIVAMGDLFQDRLDSSKKSLLEKVPDKINVTDERMFTGFDNYQGVLACDLDMVILATPPHFRPQHLQAAIEAGKHVFMEKPVAVDPVGIRSVIASSRAAGRKGLGIVAGTQRRHQPHYLEVMKRIHDGAIGEIVAAQCYWNQGKLWVKPQKPEWSDMEWQCRNWLYFCWLSGDHIVEQHVHNLDVVNWALKAHPRRVMGLGGRQVRTGPEFGNIFDHFAIEYQYPRGVRVFSSCRQIHGCSDRVSERIVGTKGVVRTDSRNAVIEGENPWKFETQGESVNPYVQEHADLIAGIRSGEPLNEGVRIAHSTLTAIMGRMSAYTGRELKWDWARDSSELDLTPAAYSFGDLPVVEVPTPGVTKLV